MDRAMTVRSRRRCRCLILLVGLCCACARRPAGGEFRIDHRFQIELFASEPLLDGPFAMKFDDKGRILVFEAPAYPVNSQQLVRVKLLEDTNGDHRPDRSTLVSTPIPIPEVNRTSDPEGRIFTTYPRSHVQYLGRNISDHGETALIFPITENPVYPVLTEPDQSDSTAAIAYYSNRSIAGFDRALLTAEPVHNLVHCDLIEESTDGPIARRAQPRSEFLASTDTLFRPLSLCIGPDGAIYVVDFHGPVAGPTEVLEAGVKPLELLFRSAGKGRIYRITPRPHVAGAESPEPSRDWDRAGSEAAHAYPPPEEVRSIDLPSGKAALEKLISDPTQPDVRQAAAVRSLGSLPGDQPALFLLSRWRSLTTAPRLEAMEALFKDASRLNLLLEALEKEQIPRWSLDEAHRIRLLAGDDSALASRTRKLLEAHDPDRDPLVRKYEAALTKRGDRSAGEVVYKRLCGRCHTFRGGTNYGPDLWTVSSKPPRRTLVDILLPSERMASGREMYLIDLKQGGNVDGVIGSQTETCIFVLHDESRQETVLREDIQRILLSDSSAMPADLASQLTVQDMTDLLRFLTTR
jgi:putative heme-binding domain-containing protein